MLLMMGGEKPETCWATYKCQVINFWNCCILLVELFESYDDARTRELQKHRNLVSEAKDQNYSSDSIQVNM
jgi:hypothetical protein